MREINKIIVHCSATPPSMDIGVDEIRDWHVNGNGWSDVGYHYVIRRDGSIETGRPIDVVGAHAKGHNSDSIGICLVGGITSNGESEFNFTYPQVARLMLTIDTLKVARPNLDVIGHNEVSHKDCPCFNVGALYNGGVM